jgi:YD repeat-containing protein
MTVTKPDLTTLSFEYDSNGFISAVKDSDGKILESHTYDSKGRGLTSSRAGGVDAVTITYPNP